MPKTETAEPQARRKRRDQRIAVLCVDSDGDLSIFLDSLYPSLRAAKAAVKDHVADNGESGLDIQSIMFAPVKAEMAFQERTSVELVPVENGDEDEEGEE